MKQVAKMLTDPVDGFLREKKFLIMDRDSIFSEAFRRELRENGIRPLRTPASSPNCNAYAERFVGSIRREVTSRMSFSVPTPSDAPYTNTPCTTDQNATTKGSATTSSRPKNRSGRLKARSGAAHDSVGCSTATTATRPDLSLNGSLTIQDTDTESRWRKSVYARNLG